MERPRKMYQVRGPDGLDEVLARLHHGVLAVDTETTGLDWKKDLVGSINLAAGDTAIFAHGNALKPVVRWLHRQIKNRRKLVFHNAKYDMHLMRETFGLHIPYPVHDTMIMSHLLDNRGAPGRFRGGHGGHKLKLLTKTYVDPSAEEPEKELMRAIKERTGNKKQNKGDWIVLMDTEDEDLVVKYSALDPWYTLQLYEQFIERIRHWPQPEGYPPLMKLYQTERWLTLCLRDMEERGFKANRPFLEQWQQELAVALRKSRRRLEKLAGKEINWNSTPQLRVLLYEDMGLSTERMNKKKTDLSTDKMALVKLPHPIGAELLQYRKLAKQHGTFATGLLNALTANNTLHTNFNQNVDTGRMSSYDPNLQQEDRTSGVRKAFVPRKGLELRFADYSQVEMRYAVHVAQEEMLIKGFNEDPDFDMHQATAIQMYGRPDPLPHQRKYAKDMNFATIYGSGEDKTTEMLMERISVKEAVQSCRELGYRPSFAESPHRALAKLLRARYKEVIPRMKKTAREEEQICKRRGFTMTLYGRHRYLDENEAYKAFNTKIQGSAADAAKRGLVNVYREMQLGTGELALLVQVHDEIIYETEGDKRVDRRVLELLSDDSFSIPIVADMSGSKISWQDKEKIKL